jgi:three-Cys-motif partner protein
MYNYLDRLDDGLPMRQAGAWAAEKLDYLRRYIEIFGKSMHYKWPERNYIDLLAGPGKNRMRSSGEVILGSPLLALKTQFPFTRYFFIDADKLLAAALAERCNASSLRDRVIVETGDCNVLVNQIVGDLRLRGDRALNLAFLDPEGLELQWETVARLASIRKMDMVINYPEGGLNRCMAKEFETTGATSVDAYFGSRDWRTIYRDYLKVGRAKGLHRELIDFYKSRLLDLGYVNVVRGDEVTGDEPLMRNTKMRAPLYRLIFASKHKIGQEFWDAVTRRDVYGQRRLFDGI